jgi:hypothetical protein
MPDSDFRHALQRYRSLRETAFRVAERDAWYHGGIPHPVRFTEIDEIALASWRTTWNRAHPFGYGAWDWEDLVRPVWRRPSGFHVAIWSQDLLCGLAAGRASKRRPSGRRHTLSVHFLEGNPDPGHPLKGYVAYLAIACAHAYGAALGVSTLRLVNPLAGVRKLYSGLGFSIAGNGGDPLYFERSIRR